jgi:phosphatidylinositol alpha-1,6-mannosyltransferase
MPNRTLEEDQDTEGFGIVFLEAGACRLPVIGGRAGGTADAVEDGQTGYLVNNSSPREIAEAAVRILTDQGLYERLSGAGYRRATEEFSWDRRRSEFREALQAFQLKKI